MILGKKSCKMLGKILNDLQDLGRAITRYQEKVSQDLDEAVISSC